MTLFPVVEKNLFYDEKWLFSNEPTGIGLLVRKCAEIGQKLDFRVLFSEIYMQIEHISTFEHNYTSAPIAQLADRLTFFI